MEADIRWVCRISVLRSGELVKRLIDIFHIHDSIYYVQYKHNVCNIHPSEISVFSDENIHY